MTQREILIPRFESLLVDFGSISLEQSEIDDMCSFVKAAQQNESTYCNAKCDFDLKRREYKLLKKRKSRLAKQKLYYLNCLLLVNGCYNDYSNTRVTKSSLGKIKRIIDFAISDFQELMRNNVYYDISEETTEWLMNNAIKKSLLEEGMKERQFKDVKIFVKHSDAKKYHVGNHVNRLFYNNEKYGEKDIVFFIPIIKGEYSDYEKFRDNVVDAYIQQMTTMNNKTKANYKQTMFCTPVWIDVHSSTPLIKKVW